MTTVMSVVVRALLVWWVIDSLQALAHDESREIRNLRRNIEFLRRWNERIGQWILALEKEYAELVT